jgi:hypothetical protein
VIVSQFRLAGVGLLALAVLTAVTLAGVVSRARSAQSPPSSRLQTARTPLRPPFLMFRALAPPAAHDRVAMIAIGDAKLTRAVTPLSCARVHFSGGRGLCLIEESVGTVTRHAAIVFDRSFRQRHRILLPGVPTRVRVSPDGRLAAVSTYAEEETPAGERLALESMILDLEHGGVLADLREFDVDPQGPAIGMPRDFASVAFDADGDRFYATLSTLTNRHLVIGSVRNRRLRVIGDGFANEALSPDGRRLVVKRVTDRGFWQLSILELPSMTEHRLEHGTRSIDDQVEWLDDESVIFHDATGTGTGIWQLAVDGAGPELLMLDAYSPVVVR